MWVFKRYRIQEQMEPKVSEFVKSHSEGLELVILTELKLGAIFILRKDIGVGGWSRKWQFSLTLCSENVLT